MEKLSQTNLPHPFLPTRVPTRGKQLGPLHYMLSCHMAASNFYSQIVHHYFWAGLIPFFKRYIGSREYLFSAYKIVVPIVSSII
jgi:hypothetical protein